MIAFDVGANDGSSSWELLKQGYKVYAFEPTPQLLDRYLYPKASDDFIVVPFAVSDFEGSAIFKVAGLHDWGCSSLNTFSDGLDETWHGRTDFQVTEEIEVQVTTLKKFIEDNCIEQIDYLHVDTQGSDLSVLRGLGDKINIVQEGVVETPQNESVKLYKEQHTHEEMVNFLEDNGFVIWQILTQQNEHNVYFRRKQ